MHGATAGRRGEFLTQHGARAPRQHQPPLSGPPPPASGGPTQWVMLWPPTGTKASPCAERYTPIIVACAGEGRERGRNEAAPLQHNADARKSFTERLLNCAFVMTLSPQCMHRTDHHARFAFNQLLPNSALRDTTTRTTFLPTHRHAVGASAIAARRECPTAHTRCYSTRRSHAKCSTSNAPSRG